MKISVFFIYLFTLFAKPEYSHGSEIVVLGKSVEIIDSTYPYNDSTTKSFYELNGSLLWKTRTEIRELKFDHCNHRIQIIIYLDTLGGIKHLQLLESSGLPKIDSIALNKMQVLSDKFHPSIYHSQLTRSIIFIQFKYFDDNGESYFSNAYPKDGMSYFTQDINIVSYNLSDHGSMIQNKCDDDLFYYTEGIKFFGEKKYAKAIYNFSQAMIYNPYDLEALYNMGIAYYKNENTKKACKCFSEGMEKGDIDSFNAYNKYCTVAETK